MNDVQKLIKTSVASLFALLFGFIAFNAQATTILITPTTPGVIPGSSLTPPTGPGNCEAGCVYDAFGLPNDGSLSLLYKSNSGDPSGIGSDEGFFSGSYTTTFSNSATDPENALIVYDSGASITCPDCYLAIKDGNQNPSYYFYDLASWDGLMDISLEGFWPGSGAISHVSIWGTPGTNIPEPGIVFLLGIGLLGFVLANKTTTQYHSA